MAVAAVATAVLPPGAAALAMKTPSATVMVGALTKINNQLKLGGAAGDGDDKHECDGGGSAAAVIARWRGGGGGSDDGQRAAAG